MSQGGWGVAAVSWRIKGERVPAYTVVCLHQMSVCAFYPPPPFYPLDICLCKNARRIEIKTTLGTAPQNIIVSLLFQRKQHSNHKFIDRRDVPLFLFQTGCIRCPRHLLNASSSVRDVCKSRL